MIDFRLYRLAWIPAAIAAVVAMFSFSGAPEAIEPVTPTGTFEAERAAGEARRIASRAPERAPGGAGDERTAELVEERFSEIPAGIVSEQGFETGFDGDEVSVRNVWLTLPGDAASTVVVLAPRDSPRGPGAASSAAATGVLIELASALGVAGHSKTYVLASTSGGPEGARQLLEDLPERESVEAVIAISQPGVAEPRAPFVVTSSTDTSSGSVQLERTAELAVERQAQRTQPEPGAFAQLARLAIPAGFGGQAPLIAEGIDAVTISSAGERPLDEAEAAAFSGQSLDAFGRAVHSTVAAVDIADAPLEHGPGTYLELSDNLIGGWTLSMLALVLLLPAAVAATDAVLRALRRRAHPVAGLAWAAARSLPFVGALAALYALALIGAVPRPGFPFDPTLHELGARAWIAFAVIALGAGLSAYLLRSLGATGARAPAGSALGGLGAVAAGAAILIWIANPYLALLIAPAAHVWLLAAGPSGTVRASVAAAAAIASCLPALAALISVAGAVGLGGDAPWAFLLMVANGQIGLAVTAPACFLGGALAGTVALATRRPGGEIPATA